MGDAGTTSAVYAARPRIRLENQAEPILTQGMFSFLVEETTAGLYRCEANFGNWGTRDRDVGFLYLDRQVFDFGKAFAVVAGDAQTEAVIFDGRIAGLEAHYLQTHTPQLTVLAEDRFQDLRMTRRTRTFEDASDRDVIEQIAAENGLSPDIDLDGPTYRVLAQVNQSDLAFIRERARAVDGEVWVDGATLFAQARRRRDKGTVRLTYGRGLQSFSVTADLATQRTSLSVSGWDVDSKEGVEFEATEAAIRSELNGFESGTGILQNAFGKRVERIVHMVPFNQDEARYFAEAHYRRMARGFVRGHGVAEGDGRIRVGTRIEIQGVGGLFGQAYYVTDVRHTFDMVQGFLTQFTVERPGLAPGRI